MEKLRELISSEEIESRVKQIAQALDEDYQGEELVLVVVLKGALCIAADLIRVLKTPILLEFVRAQSYGQKGTQRGELRLEGQEHLDIEGKHVLLVDDILDSGHTITKILAKLKEKNPLSLRTLVLLSKNVTRACPHEADYTLFSVENRFVIGCGLDYKEYDRGLPGIYTRDDL